MKREQQTTFASTGFERFSRQSKRAVFLAEMDAIVPWRRLCALIQPHYPTGEGGRPPIPLERMLRIYFLQQWLNLSDPAVEEALYDMASMGAFAGVDLGDAPAPDETTVCKFRQLLEEHDLGPAILREVNQFLASRKVKVATGTIVDATIIHAPSSTKNSSGERDPEMHQTKKGNQWYFGMKAHIGVDSKTRLVHAFVATAANVHDRRVLPDLLHGKEARVWGDSAYRGQTAVIRAKAPYAADFTHRRVLLVQRTSPSPSRGPITPGLACVLAANMSSTYSSASSASVKCGIVGWPKRPSACGQLRSLEPVPESKALAAGVVRPNVPELPDRATKRPPNVKNRGST